MFDVKDKKCLILLSLIQSSIGSACHCKQDLFVACCYHCLKVYNFVPKLKTKQKKKEFTLFFTAQRFTTLFKKLITFDVLCQD
jgi:hypothetical protein